MACVYGLHNFVVDKWYVGQTVNLSCRWASHRWNLRNGVLRNHYLQRSWNKYGEDAFEFVVLEEISDYTLLTEREQFWIEEKKSNSLGVYNVRVAADSNCGIKYPPMPVAQRRKISATLTGTKRSLEEVSKSAFARRGTKRSVEQCARISAGRKGIKISSAAIKKSGETRARRRAERKILLGGPKLTWLEVDKIRKFLLVGLSGVVLAKQFGVSKATISDIKHRRTWNE